MYSVASDQLLADINSTKAAVFRKVAIPTVGKFRDNVETVRKSTKTSTKNISSATIQSSPGVKLSRC